MHDPPLNLESCLANFVANLGWAFTPVPIAVPPMGISNNLFSRNMNVSFEFFNWEDHPESSWLKSMGIASIRWVLPVFTKSSTLCAFLSILIISLSRAG